MKSSNKLLIIYWTLSTPKSYYQNVWIRDDISLAIKIIVMKVTYEYMMTSSDQILWIFLRLNDPIYSVKLILIMLTYMLLLQLHSFFLRTSKLCFRLAVLNLFYFRDWNVLTLSLFPQMNLAMPQRRISETHYFISFILFLSSSAQRQPLGNVLQKIGSATVLKPIKQYLRRSSIFH